MEKLERRLIIEAKKGDKKAIEELYNKYIDYIKNLAVNYQKLSTHLTYDDLMQDGYIGFINAIEKYNLDYDVKFWAYAFYCVKTEMINDIFSFGDVCRMPLKLYQKYGMLWYKYKMAIEIFDESDVENISRYMNVSKEELMEFIHYYQKYGFSLNEKIDDYEIIDYIIDDSKNVEEEVERKILNESIRKFSMELLDNDREREIIKLRYGFDGEAMTLKEIAKIYNLSVARVRQLEQKALKKLRQFKRNLELCGDNELMKKYAMISDCKWFFDEVLYEKIIKDVKNVGIYGCEHIVNDSIDEPCKTYKEIEESICNNSDCKRLVYKK